MSAEQTVRKLLDDAGEAAARKAARIAWVREAIAALRAAHKRVDQAWERTFAALPDDIDEEELEGIPAPPEQAELDAIHAAIRAVVDHDRWPRELYFGQI